MVLALLDAICSRRKWTINKPANKRARLCPLVISAREKIKQACNAEYLGATLSKVARQAPLRRGHWTLQGPASSNLGKGHPKQREQQV